MDQYQKLYAFLVGKIDDALTILDTGDPLDLPRVRDILESALMEAEEQVIQD